MNLIALHFNNHRIARKCMSYFTLCSLPNPLPQKKKEEKNASLIIMIQMLCIIFMK